ncbi:MAG: hypothetical protein AAGN35_26870 [Bacteroidota bacterium]
MHPVHEALTWIHIISGGSMLLLGMVLIVLPGKGMLRHKQAGRAFAVSTALVVLTALLVIAFFRFSPFLLAIAVLSAYMCFSGYRVFSRKRPGTARTGDWMGAVMALLSGLALIGYGCWLLSATVAVVLAILSLVFGAFLLLLAYRDIRDFRKAEYSDNMWWWYHHMSSMLGAWLAALTAFLVQNGDWLLPNVNLGWILWVAPGVIGGIAIAVWVGKYRKKFQTRRR